METREQVMFAQCAAAAAAADAAGTASGTDVPHSRAGHGVQSALSQQRVNNRRAPATGPGGVLTLRYRSVPLFNLPRGENKTPQDSSCCSVAAE